MTKKKRSFRESCEHFRKWQEKPFDYELATNEEQHCNNCGRTFIGNFCPYCSQKAGEGYIGWKSVQQSVMDVWGLGSRSLPNTVWQLFLRPGYLISDYISGKRQVSFPPVKMLFILSVVAIFLSYYVLPFFAGDDFDLLGEERMKNMIRGIRREAESASGLHEGYARTGRKRMSKEEIEELECDPASYAKLKNEVVYLRQEVEFLKKISQQVISGKRGK